MDGRVSSALALPGRAIAAIGDAAANLTRPIFSATRSAWYQLIYARTRYNYRHETGDPTENSIIAALIGWIGRNFPEAPVTILEPGPEGPTPIPPAATGPGFMLRLLERPNAYYSGPLLWMATITDYMIGNGYWYKERNGSGRVTALWWLPSWMIEPRWDPNDPFEYIGWYDYTVDGVRYAIPPSDVVHFRNGLDPRNTRKGLGRLGSLWRELFTDNEAANMTAALMRNLGVPGVIIAPANTNQGPMRIKADEVKQKFDETFGGDGRGGTMVLTRPTEVKQLSWSPEQMNLRELRRIPEERASAVIGIPAGVAQLGAGLDRNTFTNYAEANVAAYTQAVIPLQRLISADLEIQLLDEFANLDDGWDVQFDWTQVKSMAAFVDAIWKRYADAAVRGLITRADFKRATFQKVDPGDDVYIAPNNYVFTPAGRTPQPALQAPPAPPQLPPGRSNGNGNGHHQAGALDELELIAEAAL